MNNTIKHETVLEKARRQHHGEPWIFVTPDDGGLPGAQLRLTDREWEDLGRPETITIAVWPGDKLNEQPFTRATREELDEETQKAYRESMGDSDGGTLGGENVAKPE